MSAIETPQETIPRFEAPETPEETTVLIRILEGNDAAWQQLMQVKHEDPRRYEEIQALMARAKAEDVSAKEQQQAAERVLRISGMLREQVRRGPFGRLRGAVGL
ncbi:MAG: hypothetical protein PHU04_01505 [Candidatus Peribacteraceae bacterium]|nr:hypothetical protein [Candidatus Peribacteraceae bacterium]